MLDVTSNHDPDEVNPFGPNSNETMSNRTSDQHTTQYANFNK